MRILVLGISGMLGSAVFKVFSLSTHEVFGTVRSATAKKYFKPELASKILTDVDVLNTEQLEKTIAEVRPDVVINCVGLVKQLADAKDPLIALPINSMLPHHLARICKPLKARVVHISTDCVFDGTKGNYLESEFSDADDLYGRSKFLGELTEESHTITLRTSIIGHELNTSKSLVDWFLSQKGSVKGYRRAIFSGVPTVEMADIILNYVIPNPYLMGLYHVSADPINKYELLKLVNEVYGQKTEIIPDDSLVIDRSLNSERFQKATGYKAAAWPHLIKKMFASKE